MKKIEEVSHASTEGISLLGIKDGAEKLGFKSMAGKFTIEQLNQIKFPIILHWNQNHLLYSTRKIC